MTGPGQFFFLNVEGAVSSARDWQRADRSRLWLYNLHYFDDLAASDASARAAWHRDLVRRWIVENPPARGTGWEPYPTSLRIVNWVKAALRGSGAIDEEAVTSLSIQARWLRGRLEKHLLGNHLWANAKALVFAGTFFEGREADAWRAEGLAILRHQLREQILPDGGHFERSPMYHSIILEDVLDLVQLASRAPSAFVPEDVQSWRQTAQRMIRWLRVMTHPDGDLSFFNDTAFGVAPRLGELEDYAATVGVLRDATPLGAIESLPDSGYVRLESGPAVVIADVGEIGPRYLPGHAHADTLSFELSLHGRRVLVNGGTSTYDDGPERLAERGTASHNTVVVDGEDSSEVWSSFRVARRAEPSRVSHGGGRADAWLEGTHDGYRRLPGRVTHQRRWELRATELSIADHLDGLYTHATAGFLLHPSASTLSLRGTTSTGTLESKPAHFSSSFGCTETTTRYVASVPRHGLVTTWAW